MGESGILSIKSFKSMMKLQRVAEPTIVVQE